MNPVTHLLLGWGAATATPLDRRDRALVTLAGVLPDIDGLGIVAELATRDSEQPLYLWTSYHHMLAHNLPFGFALLLGAVAVARKRAPTPLLVLGSFHLHLLCDLVGARGPDGASWPIRYLFPFHDLELSWAGQWPMNAWPNFLITAAALAWVFAVAAGRGHSPLELLSRRADAAFVATVRRWFRRAP